MQQKSSKTCLLAVEKAHRFLRRFVRWLQMILRYFLSGIGTRISVPSLNRKLRSLSLPTVTISTVEFQRFGSNSVRISHTAAACPASGEFLSFCSGGHGFWIPDRRSAPLAADARYAGRYIAYYTPPVLHLMLIFLKCSLSASGFQSHGRIEVSPSVARSRRYGL